MAKSNENGEQVSEMLATDTLANLFADMNDKVIIHAGPQNTKDVDGFTVPMLIPRHYSQYAEKVAAWVSANWHGTATKDMPVAERVAYFEEYIATKWEPTEPSLRSPIEQAAFDRLLVVNAATIKPTATEKEKNKKLDPIVAGMLNNPAQTERGRPVIEAYLSAFRDYEHNAVKRGRKGVASEEIAPEDMVASF